MSPYFESVCSLNWIFFSCEQEDIRIFETDFHVKYKDKTNLKIMHPKSSPDFRAGYIIA